MNIETLRQFFKWCTIINGGLLIVSALSIWLADEVAFDVHRQWIALTREQFNLSIYLLVGTFKLLFIVFNLVPYLALVIVGRQQRSK